MPTINYSAEALWGNRGEGTASINLTSGSSYIFGITSSFQGYFTMETTRNYQGFYDNTSPLNLSGTFSSFTNIITSVSSSYIAGFVPNPGFSSFVFTPNTNVNGDTLYLRGTGDVHLGLTAVSLTPNVGRNFQVSYINATGSTVNWSNKTSGEAKCDWLYAMSQSFSIGGNFLYSVGNPTLGSQLYTNTAGTASLDSGKRVVNDNSVYTLTLGVVTNVESFDSLPACV